MVEDVAGLRQTRDAIRDLGIHRGSLPQGKVGQLRRLDREEIGHGVVPDAHVYGECGTDLPIVLNVDSGVECAVTPVIGGFQVSYEVYRCRAFADGLVLDEIKQVIEVIGGAVEGTVLGIRLADIELVETELESVRLDGCGHDVTPADCGLGEVSWTPIGKPLQSRHVDIGNSLRRSRQIRTVRTDDIESAFVEQARRESVGPI